MNTAKSSITHAKLKRQPKVLDKVTFVTLEVTESDIYGLEGLSIDAAAFKPEAKQALDSLNEGDEIAVEAHVENNTYNGKKRLVIDSFITESSDSIDYVSEWFKAENLQTLTDAGWVNAQEPKRNDKYGYDSYVLKHPTLEAQGEAEWITASVHDDGNYGQCPWMF